MEKVKETVNNYHKADSSAPKTNGHHIEVEKTTNTVNKNRSNIHIHNKKVRIEIYDSNFFSNCIMYVLYKVKGFLIIATFTIKI